MCMCEDLPPQEITDLSKKMLWLLHSVPPARVALCIRIYILIKGDSKFYKLVHYNTLPHKVSTCVQ